MLRRPLSPIRHLAAAGLAAGLLAASVLAADEPTAGVPDATVPLLPATNYRFLPAHESFLARIKEGPIGLLFLGDSITAGWTKKAPEVWDEYFGRYQPANFGIGSDFTQGVLWRIAHGELDGISPRVVVLLLGTNNTNQHTAPQITAGLTAVVRAIQSKLPETKILLLAIFPRGPRKDESGRIVDDAVRRMEIIRAVNRELAKLDDGRKVRFLDVGGIFLDAERKVSASLMPDLLHPNAAGYRRWAEAMQPLLDDMMSPGASER